jgi:signal transduction histidine kinase
MKPEDLENAFSLFSKGDDRAGQNKEGSGLGLMLCKRIVERLGGEISIESKRNVGTIITFTIIPGDVQCIYNEEFIIHYQTRNHVIWVVNIEVRVSHI